MCPGIIADDVTDTSLREEFAAAELRFFSRSLIGLFAYGEAYEGHDYWRYDWVSLDSRWTATLSLGLTGDTLIAGDPFLTVGFLFFDAEVILSAIFYVFK